MKEYKELIYTLKQELKVLSNSIIAAKKSRKTYRNGYVPNLKDLQFQFRVKHVFRCLLRGKTLDQIENSRLVREYPLTPLEINLHRTLSHLYNNYTVNMRYNHRIQCMCLKCGEFKAKGDNDEKVMCANSF